MHTTDCIWDSRRHKWLTLRQLPIENWNKYIILLIVPLGHWLLVDLKQYKLWVLFDRLPFVVFLWLFAFHLWSIFTTHNVPIRSRFNFENKWSSQEKCQLTENERLESYYKTLITYKVVNCVLDGFKVEDNWTLSLPSDLSSVWQNNYVTPVF